MDKHDQFDTQQQPSQTPLSESNPLEDKEPSSQGGQTQQQKGNSLPILNHVETQTTLLVRLLGYGLLILALIDYVYIIIPPRFTDPNWELQTIGKLVDNVAILLTGLIFVFYRRQGYIRIREKKFLGFLSWVSLLIGLLYLLIIPLGIADTWRIYYANKAQTAAQLSQQSQRLEQVKNQLNQATTDEQLKQLIASLTPQGRLSQINNTQAFKDQFLTKISQTQQSIKMQADNAQKNQVQTLLKNSLKWNLGALTAGVLFIWIWYSSHWTRRKKHQ